MLNKERPEVIDALIEWITNSNYFPENFEKETGFKGDFYVPEELKSWLNSEYVEPYQITQAEKVILESLPEGFGWIARDGNEVLCVYEAKPTKDSGLGYFIVSKKHQTFKRMECFEHLFKFVDFDNSPLKVSDILENCEVID